MEIKLPSRAEIKTRKKTESPIEGMLLREFHLMGIYPVPQYWVGNYRIDLAFVDEKLAIECDGKEWHNSLEQKQKDQEKDSFLKENGWKVMRITGGQIYHKVDEIVKELLQMPGRDKKEKASKIFIDYIEDNFDAIEDKEEILKRQNEENENCKVNDFEKLGDCFSRRFNKSI